MVDLSRSIRWDRYCFVVTELIWVELAIGNGGWGLALSKVRVDRSVLSQGSALKFGLLSGITLMSHELMVCCILYRTGLMSVFHSGL